MIEALFAYLVSGQFWFANFVALLVAWFVTIRISSGGKTTFFWHSSSTRRILVVTFVICTVIINASVAGVVAGVHSVM